ncbi:MAG: dihydroorotate oxidase [Candidatus Paceibacterota bacterium]|jgi:dihydroorotate dehydrogenase (fumarate)|nr:dihydroorotate oxidase [Candidatus Paceibacterota bacterium]
MGKKNISTATSIAGVELDSYVCNASGPKCTTYEELTELGRSDSSAIVMKSATILPREGNPEPRLARVGKHGLVQSMGLPNLGYEKYVGFSKKLTKFGKRIIGSIAGFSFEEYVVMVKAFQKSDVDLIEINVSCPNIEGKSLIGRDFGQLRDLLTLTSGLGTKPIGLKLPQYDDPAHWFTVAELVLEYGVSFITCINSIGNTLVIDPWTRKTVTSKNGLAGLSGETIMPIALANVRAFYELLGGKVSIFGVGGVIDGVSAFQFLLAGADAVQVGTAFELNDASCFTYINKGLIHMLEYHGFSSVEEAKGQLLYI